jgi:hypothetical protein
VNRRLVWLFLLSVAFLCAVSVSVPAYASTDEFIWRDRWTRMDQLFQLGYVIGVFDTVAVMAIHVRLGLLPSTLRAVHTCAAQFTTIRSAVDFTTAAMQKQTDPLTPVATVIYRTLNECATAENAPNITSDNLFALGGKFLWKDRLENDLSNGSSPYYYYVTSRMTHSG